MLSAELYAGAPNGREFPPPTHVSPQGRHGLLAAPRVAIKRPSGLGISCRRQRANLTTAPPCCRRIIRWVRKWKLGRNVIISHTSGSSRKMPGASTTKYRQTVHRMPIRFPFRTRVQYSADCSAGDIGDGACDSECP